MKYIFMIILILLLVSGCQKKEAESCGDDFRPACLDKERIIMCNNVTNTVEIVNCLDIGKGYCKYGRCGRLEDDLFT